MAGRVRRRWGEEEGELGEEVVHPLEEGQVEEEEEGEEGEGEGPASSLCLCRKKRSSQATTKQFY